MKVKLSCIFIFVVLILGLMGCSSSDKSSDNQNTGLCVTSMMQSIGAAEGQKNNYDVQKFSYSLTLANNDREEVYIKEVHVLLPAEFEKRVTTKNYLIDVDKTVAPNSFIEIENLHEFDAKGLTKEAIEDLNPGISSIRVVTEKTINLEDRF